MEYKIAFVDGKLDELPKILKSLYRQLEEKSRCFLSTNWDNREKYSRKQIHFWR